MAVRKATARKKTPAQIAAAARLAETNAYKLLALSCGIEAGDTVRVLRGYKENELGCGLNPHNHNIEEYIGDEAEVSSVDSTDGTFELDWNGDYFPFFCLEKITDPLKVRINDEYVAQITDDGDAVEVGCQVVEFDAVEKLYNAMKAAQNK